MTVGIVGLGLIGGSIGLALREPGRTLIGYDSIEAAANVALGRMCVDRLASLEEVAQADVVFIAVPPAYVVETAEAVMRGAGSDSVVTDCTSVKTEIAEWAMRTKQTRFVPGHPMAGHEKSGAGFASSWMFRGARWLLTPIPGTQAKAIRTVEALVKGMGATPVQLDAANHDRNVALLSHLPHILAGSLLQLARDVSNPEVGGGSWRDLTRVGGVDPNLWTQILMGNRVELVRVLEEAQGSLKAMQAILESGDREAVHQWLVEAESAKKVQPSVTAVKPESKLRKVRKSRG